MLQGIDPSSSKKGFEGFLALVLEKIAFFSRKPREFLKKAEDSSKNPRKSSSFKKTLKNSSKNFTKLKLQPKQVGTNVDFLGYFLQSNYVIFSQWISVTGLVSGYVSIWCYLLLNRCTNQKMLL